jgi:hypothetical protein
VETERCPGCGAKVRPDSSWCSLCYQDLRPQPLLVTASAQADTVDKPAAPVVEASLDPQASECSGGLGEHADDDIVDAELVGEDGRIIAPRNGGHDADRRPAPGAEPSPSEVAQKAEAAAQASRLAALTWICKCGEVVSFEQTACPVCGGSFLGDLNDGNGGRHRPGSGALNWLPESRQVRLAAAAFIAIAFAVLVPLILTLFG